MISALEPNTLWSFLLIPLYLEFTELLMMTARAEKAEDTRRRLERMQRMSIGTWAAWGAWERKGTRKMMGAQSNDAARKHRSTPSPSATREKPTNWKST
jgi:hypothetical protein